MTSCGIPGAYAGLGGRSVRALRMRKQSIAAFEDRGALERA
jgi:hypothetical protein